MQNIKNQKKYTKKFNDKNNSKNMPKINPHDVYMNLKTTLNERTQLKLRQIELWKIIKRGNNRSNEMNELTEKIGAQTHKINKIISVLMNHKNEPGAYKLAIDFLKEEIQVTKRQIEKWNETIHMVEIGFSSLINSSGERHHDTSNLKLYVKKKNEKLNKLENELNCLKRKL